MNTGRLFLVVFFLIMATVACLAQEIVRTRSAVTYEEVYDDPYAINKLFLAFQPLYGEVFATNVNAGFGFEAHYFLKDKANIKGSFRKPYSRTFYDFTRDLAHKNSDVDNSATVFGYFELGGTIHVKDVAKDSKTKLVLYKSIYRKNIWAAMVPLNIEVPCKVRQITGVRLGGIYWDSSVDINRVLEKQGLDNSDLQSPENVGLPEGINIFSNITSAGLYVGGSMTWIRNMAVDIDKFESNIDDGIFTAFFDVLYTPSLTLDNIVYTPQDVNGVPIVDQRRTYDVSPIKTKAFGFRAGIEGKFNRTLGWSYGGEFGYRPSVEGYGFFAMIKIGFPVYSTDLNYKVEAFGK